MKNTFDVNSCVSFIWDWGSREPHSKIWWNVSVKWDWPSDNNFDAKLTQNEQFFSSTVTRFCLHLKLFRLCWKSFLVTRWIGQIELHVTSPSELPITWFRTFHPKFVPEFFDCPWIFSFVRNFESRDDRYIVWIFFHAVESMNFNLFKGKSLNY